MTRTTCGDLDPDTELHHPGRRALGSKMHTDRDCLHLQNARIVMSTTAGVRQPDEKICARCSGDLEEIDQATKQPNGMINELLETDPEELGLTPIGDRSALRRSP